MPSWLRPHFSYADVSASTLRATLATLRISGLFARQRAAIEQELLVREWAERVEEHLVTAWSCSWCERGGIS